MIGEAQIAAVIVLGAPWLALAATFAWPTAARIATQLLGTAWSLAAMWVIGSAPHAMVQITEGWIIPAAGWWGIAASGLIVWRLGVSSGEDETHAAWIHALCGAAAVVWCTANAWWLLTADGALLALSAGLIGSRKPSHGNSLRSQWLAGLWADAVLGLAILSAAGSLRSLSVTELSAAARIAELDMASPGMIALIGLLWGIAICGRLFQFPFGSVRDLAGTASAPVNAMVWGLAMLPVATRWMLAGRAWWSAVDALTDLADGWSTIAALAAVCFALGSADVRIRIAWLLGAQTAWAVQPLVAGDPVISGVVFEQWCLAACAATWLFGGSPTPSDGANRAPSTGSTTAIAALAAIVLAGILIWPCALPETTDSSPHWISAVQLAVHALAGLAVVVLAADASQSSRALWDGAWLVAVPIAAVMTLGQSGACVMSGAASHKVITIWLASAAGILIGILWRCCPAAWQEPCCTAIAPLTHVAGTRFFTLDLWRFAIDLPIRGVAQLCLIQDRLLELIMSRGIRRLQCWGPTDDELHAAGIEFYALALGLSAMAITLTVMWLESSE